MYVFPRYINETSNLFKVYRTEGKDYSCLDQLKEIITAYLCNNNEQ